MQNKHLIIPSILGLLFIAIGCKKEDKTSKPSVITAPVTEITSVTVTCGGNITADGGAPITSRGVVWGTVENPTLVNNIRITNNGTGTGSFISLITDLTPGASYHVRAYATNTIGTNYGEDITFTTNGAIDIDGNIYKTVKIGTQVWMAENLKTTKYNNGNQISNVTNDSEWGILTIGAYAWQDNNEASYKNSYGALYNWYAVETGNLCPTGWHVPTHEEWTTLIEYLGGERIAGGKLKETGTTHWNNINAGATNIVGFTALPGGVRDIEGSFLYVGSEGEWWSATKYSTNNAWMRYMSYSGIYVGRSDLSKKNGLSVRCVRD